MRTSTQDTPTTGHNGTILVALELSQRSWLVTLHSPDRDRISRRKLTGGDHVGLLQLLEEVRSRAARKLGVEPAIVTCQEAGYDGYWLHRRLEAAGIRSLVFDPASIAVEQRRRRAKTDRIDGELLLRTLMAHCRGEPRVVRIVQPPSVAQEDARRASRERDRLIKEQTGHVNRLKAVLRLMGVGVGNPRRRDWVEFVKQQRDWNGEPIPPHLLAEVGREHARLMLVRDQLAALEQESAAAQVHGEAAEMARRREQLGRVKGLGPVFSATLVNEALYKDFDNRRQVAAYFGLAPTPWQSGASAREQGIGKSGNPRARHKAIEMAWLWLRHQPNSALSRWFYECTAQGGKRAKRVAIVALARKLVVALWRYLTCGLIPEGATVAA